MSRGRVQKEAPLLVWTQVQEKFRTGAPAVWTSGRLELGKQKPWRGCYGSPSGWRCREAETATATGRGNAWMVGVKDVLLRRKISKFRLKSVGRAYQRKKFHFQMSSGNLTCSSSFCMMYLSRPTGSVSVSLLLSFSKLHSHLHPIVHCLLPNAIKGLGQKANGARPANSTCKMHPICFAVTGIWSDLERRGQ